MPSQIPVVLEIVTYVCWTSLSGLDNINSQTINNLYLVNNNALQTCNVESICNYIANQNGSIEISNNDIGCDNIEEVEEACLVPVTDKYDVPVVFIYPNPVNKTLFVESNSNIQINEVIIYNFIGQKVIEEKVNVKQLNVSNLKNGYYIIELVTNNFRTSHKLIIK